MNSGLLFFIWIYVIMQNIVGGLMFEKKLKKKDHFFLRMILAIIIVSAVNILFFNSLTGVEFTFVGSVSFFLMTFLMTIVIFYICFEQHFLELLLCGITGYTVHYLASEMYNVLLNIWDIDRYLMISDTMSAMELFLSEFVTYIIVYTIIYFVFARNATTDITTKSSTKNIMVLLFIMLFMMIIMSSARDYYFKDIDYVEISIVIYIFSIFGSILLLMVRTGILEKSHLESELEMMNYVHYKELEQYKLRKEYIDLINIKTHDLKKLLDRYEDNKNVLTQNELDEIRNAITIYDSKVSTGNETLDTIITDKMFKCAQHHIKITSLVEGEKLYFLSISEIYSLFGNAIDNAIEGVSKVSDTNRRMIQVYVRVVKGMISITIMNPYEEQLMIKDGVFQTTKDNKQYHGYGIKSMKYIVDKYDGVFTISTDELFQVSILIPIPKNM